MTSAYPKESSGKKKASAVEPCEFPYSSTLSVEPDLETFASGHSTAEAYFKFCDATCGYDEVATPEIIFTPSTVNNGALQGPPGPEVVKTFCFKNKLPGPFTYLHASSMSLMSYDPTEAVLANPLKRYLTDPLVTPFKVVLSLFQVHLYFRAEILLPILLNLHFYTALINLCCMLNGSISLCPLNWEVTALAGTDEILWSLVITCPTGAFAGGKLNYVLGDCFGRLHYSFRHLDSLLKSDELCTNDFLFLPSLYMQRLTPLYKSTEEDYRETLLDLCRHLNSCRQSNVLEAYCRSFNASHASVYSYVKFHNINTSELDEHLNVTFKPAVGEPFCLKKFAEEALGAEKVKKRKLDAIYD